MEPPLQKRKASIPANRISATSNCRLSGGFCLAKFAVLLREIIIMLVTQSFHAGLTTGIGMARRARQDRDVAAATRSQRCCDMELVLPKCGVLQRRNLL
jgi:hypothetical protein